MRYPDDQRADYQDSYAEGKQDPMISMIVGTIDDAVMRRPQPGQAAAERDTWRPQPGHGCNLAVATTGESMGMKVIEVKPIRGGVLPSKCDPTILAQS